MIERMACKVCGNKPNQVTLKHHVARWGHREAVGLVMAREPIGYKSGTRPTSDDAKATSAM
jgi:hypothetical protein